MGYTWAMPDTDHKNVEPGTIGDAIHRCHELLAASDAFYGHGTDNPWDESVQMVLSVLGLPPDADEGVLPQVLGEQDRLAILGLLRRRLDEHVPLPYLLGRAWFAGLEFNCDRRAIIPRSPIAQLILEDFAPWYTGPAPTRVLDLCCGGGCIGLAVAHHNPGVKVDLADIDSEALALAGENRAKLGLQDRCELHRSDLFDNLAPRRYDLILSNPPYVDLADLAAMPAEYRHEPPLALGSGADGLDLTRKILAQAGAYLEKHGLLVVEVGNSWQALDRVYPQVPFTWIEFAEGGHGVFAMTAVELQDYAESFER